MQAASWILVDPLFGRLSTPHVPKYPRLCLHQPATVHTPPPKTGPLPRYCPGRLSNMHYITGNQEIRCAFHYATTAIRWIRCLATIPPYPTTPRPTLIRSDPHKKGQPYNHHTKHIVSSWSSFSQYNTRTVSKVNPPLRRRHHKEKKRKIV